MKIFILMYCVVEYLDYKKEQTIEVLSCSPNEQLAIDEAYMRAKEHKSKCNFEYVMVKHDHEYIRCINVVTQFFCVNLERQTDEEINEFKSCVQSNETIYKVCGKKVPPKFKERQKEMFLSLTNDEIRELFIEMKLENNQMIDWLPEFEMTSAETFAVVKVTDS